MSEETRTRLLKAAESILIEQGVHALTVRRIGAVSGLNSALITYHFGSMAGLLAELCRLNLEPMIAAWERLGPGDGAVAGDFDTLLDIWLRPLMHPAAFTPNGRALIVLDEIAAHGDPALSDHLLKTMVATSIRVGEVLRPHVSHLARNEFRARLRFISGAALGPPPRKRTPVSAGGEEPLDSLTHLLAFARAALLG
ncbi:MAG TPA: helix-turn-helix domain-containing protein [Sphingomonadaceae bacterium]|nr:helix-turn-helix domain-containing protein [Sphingomonadaceae bacterium]